MGLTGYFLKRGRVDSILLECDGEYAFIDGGYRRDGEKAVAFMRELGIARLRYYIASHGHKNHIGAAAAIIGAFKVDGIIVGRSKVLDAILRYADTPEEAEAIDGCGVLIMRMGDILKLGNANIYCLGPEKQKNCSCGAYSENYNSLILRLDYDGFPRMLLTGDTSAAIIAKCGDGARADILKSPHHAGTQPTALLKQVKPEIVVVCSNARAGKTYRKRIENAGAEVRNVCERRVVIDL